MFALKVLFWVSLPVFGSADVGLMFLEELQSYHTFRTVLFNIIVCPESESINLIKMFSTSFQRFIAVHRSDEFTGRVLDEPQAFVLDLECQQSERVLLQAENLGLFSKPFQWLLLTNGDSFGADYEAENQSESSQKWSWPFLESLSILTDSDVKIVEKMSNNRTTVTGIYKVQSLLFKEALAEWTSEKGLTVLNWKPIAVRRTNLHGAIWPSSAIVLYEDTLNHLDDFVNIHLDRTTKITYNIVKLYEDMFNMSLTIKIIKEWGTLVNGSWTGLAGNFQRKEIEVGCSPLFFHAQRLDILEYYGVLTPSENIFAMPFDSIVWYCCFATVAVSCVLLFTAVNYERYHSEADETGGRRRDPKVSFTEILTVNIGAICLQGTVTPVKNPPGRIITLFVYLLYMFLYISYSGSIVAILQSSDTSIRTLSDFLKSPLRAGAEDVPYSRFYFRTAEEEVRKAIYNNKIAPKGEKPHFLPLEEGIEEVRKGFFGYHVELGIGYQVVQRTFTEEEKCDLQRLKDNFLQATDPWLVFKKKSPYSELIKIGEKKSAETGVKYRFTHRLNTAKPICSSKSSRFVSVGLIDCFYAFVSLLYGYLIAFIIMILEIIFSKFSMNYAKRRNIRKNLSPQLEFLN